jgi:hypothetical protein
MATSQKRRDFWVVACGGCHQQIGLCSDKNPSRTKIFCSPMCAADLPVIAESERQDQWDFLNTKGQSPVTVAKHYGSPHALVYRTLARLRKPLDPEFPWLEAS